VDLLKAMKEIMQIQRQDTIEKDIFLDLAFFTPSMEVRELEVMIDQKRFQQVLLNFQSNAIKFMDKDTSKVLISVQLIRKQASPLMLEQVYRHFNELVLRVFGNHAADIEVQASELQLQSIFAPHPEFDKIVLSVFDNGCGISQADRPKMFQLFGCLKRSQKMNANGVGLGLVITKMITEEFGGTVQFVSLPEVGSVFQSSFLLQNPNLNASNVD
jgi:signal transduction histidine kinase